MHNPLRHPRGFAAHQRMVRPSIETPSTVIVVEQHQTVVQALLGRIVTLAVRGSVIKEGWIVLRGSAETAVDPAAYGAHGADRVLRLLAPHRSVVHIMVAI